MTDDARMTALSCADAEELAPEASLGILTGVERARVLAHLERCPTCAGLVEGMAQTADALLTLAPDIEPPSGFATRLLARQHPRARRLTRPRIAIGGAIAASLAAAAGLAVAIGIGNQPSFRVDHPAAIASLGGRALQAAPLQNAGQQVGQVFLYAGKPSWLFMTVDVDGPPRAVTCELQTATGSTVVLGTFTTSTSYRSWGSTINAPPSFIRAVRLVDTDGTTIATASLGS